MKSVICLLEEEVQKNSEKIAIMDENTSVTYQELWKQIQEVANIFAQNGIKKGMGVSVCVELSKEKIIVMLAILYLEAKFIVLEKDKLSLQQMRGLLKESKCQYCIKTELIEGAVKYVISNVLGVEHDISREKKDVDDVIYYISTSGSTGKPKLIAKTNMDIVSRIINIKCNTNLSFGGVGMQFCSFHFAFAYIEMFSQLLLGNTIFCYPTQERTNVQFLCDTIKKNAIDTIFIPTIIFNLLAKSSCFLNDFPNKLKQIIVAGGKLSVDATMANVLVDNKVKLFNDYGCAEVNSICIHQCSLHHDDLWNVPAGKQNMFVDIKIVGNKNQEGYLYVANIYDQSYRNIMDLSNYYNTGDLCKYNQVGEIVIIGRDDNQIKINGCRIDIDDVQNYVMKLTAVSECCILLVPYGAREQRMFAFITLNISMTVDMIFRELKEIMPQYMIPNFIEIVSAIDMLPSGKFDKVRMRQRALLLINKKKRGFISDNEEIVIKILRKMTNNMKSRKILLEMKLKECGFDSITFACFLVQIEKKCGKKIITNQLGLLWEYTLKQFLMYVNQCEIL